MNKYCNINKLYLSELEAKQNSKPTKSKVKSNVQVIIILSDEDDEIFQFEESDNPDWTLSSAPRRHNCSGNNLRATAADLHSSTSDANQKSFEETYATAISQPNVNGSSDNLKHKQITVRRCKCQKSCKTKHYVCRLADRSCGVNCRCGDECTNGKNNMSDSQSKTDADDEFQSN